MEEEGRRKLKDIVSELTIKWFQETLAEAKDGDVEMMVLVAQMLHEGYGCKSDPAAAKDWMTRSTTRNVKD